MKISILVDNNPGTRTAAEHGLSYLIEYDGKRLLFDTGQSNMFVENAGIMKVDLKNIDLLVLSHGHFDHGNGLRYISGTVLICHPGCFVKRYRKSDHTYIGLINTREEILSGYNLITSTYPHQISDRIFFLGEIPRITGFESQNTAFVFEDGSPDYVLDDSAVAMITEYGIMVITGCGHAGIVNTLEHAKKVTGIKKLYGIMGGFHLKEQDIQTRETIAYLKAEKVKNVFPSHCTELPALSAFYESFRIRQLKTGEILTF